MKLDDGQLYRLVFKINQVFYEYLYKDPWLKNVFAVVEQTLITRQQTDFMVGALGGPRKYSGRNPRDAHPHIFVDEEMWALREKYLKQAFQEVEAPLEIREKWLGVDEAFKDAIIKKDVSECRKRFFSDTIVHYPYNKPA